MENNLSDTQPVKQPDSSSKLLLPLLIGFLILLIGFAIYYFNTQRNQPASTQMTNLPTPTVTPSKMHFKNGTFSFSYPETWKLINYTDDPTFFDTYHISGFQRMILLQKESYYLFIGSDVQNPSQESPDVGGIFATDADYQEYLKNNSEVRIGEKKYYINKNHTSLTAWKDPEREVGLYGVASVSEYIPNKVTNPEGLPYNGYDFYIKNKNGNAYMFIKFGDTPKEDTTTPDAIQTDIKGIIESISW